MLRPSRKVLCLDWDNRSLRIVVARVAAGRMVLEDAHAHRLPTDVDAEDPPAMGDFIAQMLRRHHLRAKMVVVDIPRERAVINRLTLPPTPDVEVAAAVRFQAMRELPFPLETAAADYVITQRDESGLVLEALLAAVTLETLDRLRATCAAARLTPARIGLRPYANLVSVRYMGEQTAERVLFVDVGPGATEIDIFAGDALAFARSANVTVPVPASDTASGEGSRIISLAEVADLDASDTAVSAVVNELLVEVTRTLQAYRATEPDASVDKVVVAGATGIEPQLADALGRRLSAPVTLFDPTQPLRVAAKDAAKLRSFSAALGLAWGLSREGLLAIDFLNPKRPISSRDILRRRLRIGAAAVGVVAAIAAGVLVVTYVRLARERDGIVAENRKLKSEIDKQTEVENQVARARAWALSAIWPHELLELTRAAVEPGKRMLVQSIEMESNPRTQRMTLRNVHAAEWQVPMDFVRVLNDVRDGNEPVYEATPGAWTEIHGNPNFKGKLDIDVELKRLARQQDLNQKAEKDRKAKKPTR